MSTEKGFGPFFSRIYAFFVARPGKTYRYIAEVIAALNPQSVLDVGCGPGTAIGMLAEKLPGARIVGADPSGSMVSICSRRLSAPIAEGRVSVVQGSSMDVSVDGKFDIIFTSLSFHHWNNREEGLKHLSTLLKPGGRIMIFEKLSGSGKGGHSMSLQEAREITLPGYRTVTGTGDGMVSVSLLRSGDAASAA